MRLRPVSIVACLALGFAAAGRAQEPAPAATLSIAAVARAFAHPSDEGRVLVRWWWFGPSVSRDEIDAEMRRVEEGGLGGVELAVVYPMTLDVPASGLRNEAYLSPEFLDQVRFAAARARELGLRMDLTLGSGWSFGGPYITSDLASARLRSDRREIAPTVATLTRPVPFEGDRLVAAFIGPGSLPE